MPIAASIPNIATTTRSSIKVNPEEPLVIFVFKVKFNYSTWTVFVTTLASPVPGHSSPPDAPLVKQVAIVTIPPETLTFVCPGSVVSVPALTASFAVL